MPNRLRDAPALVRAVPARLRVWGTPAGFPFRQVGLGLATIVLAVAARRIASHGGHAGGSLSGAGMPAEVRGRWVTATSGATNYWSHSTGVYQGSGHGLSQIYEFDADGGYKSFTYMEVKTSFSWVQMNNRCQGTVTVNGDHLTLHAASGHYDATGTSYVNRDMNAEDLAKWSTTYRWRHENGADGKPRLILDNEDVAKPETTEYRVLAD